MNELQFKIKQLAKSVLDLRENGTQYAKAERDYKILLRQECLKLRDEGMAIGMIIRRLSLIKCMKRFA